MYAYMHVCMYMYVLSRRKRLNSIPRPTQKGNTARVANARQGSLKVVLLFLTAQPVLPLHNHHLPGYERDIGLKAFRFGVEPIRPYL